jgi:hypothetical protein
MLAGARVNRDSHPEFARVLPFPILVQMSEYTHIISLGGNCRLAYNLRRHFQFNSAYPFDWFIAPLGSVARMLRDPDPVATLYDPKFLRGGDDPKRIYAVRHIGFRIGMNHEFPRGDRFVVPNFLDHIEPARERQAYLFKKLSALRSDGDAKVLLVHYFSPSGLKWVNEERIAEQLVAIRDYFSKADILFVNCPVKADGVRHLLIDERDKGRGPWRGDAKVWSTALDTLGIRYVGTDQASKYAISPARESVGGQKAETLDKQDSAISSDFSDL